MNSCSRRAMNVVKSLARNQITRHKLKSLATNTFQKGTWRVDPLVRGWPPGQPLCGKQYTQAGPGASRGPGGPPSIQTTNRKVLTCYNVNSTSDMSLKHLTSQKRTDKNILL